VTDAAKQRPHRMTERVFGWDYCASCGLVAMRNAVSRKALAASCEGPRQLATGAAADRLFAKLQREGWR
jgi:hypothetical protein